MHRNQSSLIFVEHEPQIEKKAKSEHQRAGQFRLSSALHATLYFDFLPLLLNYLAKELSSLLLIHQIFEDWVRLGRSEGVGLGR